MTSDQREFFKNQYPNLILFYNDGNGGFSVDDEHAETVRVIAPKLNRRGVNRAIDVLVARGHECATVEQIKKAPPGAEIETIVESMIVDERRLLE